MDDFEYHLGLSLTRRCDQLFMYMYLMQCNPSSLDCGTVIIGTSQSHILTLTNPTLSTLYYRLHVDKEEEGERGRPVTDSSQGNKKSCYFLLS